MSVLSDDDKLSIERGLLLELVRFLVTEPRVDPSDRSNNASKGTRCLR